MPIDSKHVQYLAHESAWARCRDVLSGEEAVKAKRTAYLAMLSGMDQGDYDAYLQRALFYNATWRTRFGLLGAVFRKSPVVTDWPAARKDDQTNITLTGMSIEAFAKSVVEEILSAGRAGVIVDMPRVDPERPDTNARPYLHLYQAENILNWRVDYQASVPKLDRVVLMECLYESGNDEYDLKKVEQIRVLSLIEGQYSQQLYRKQEQADKTLVWAAYGPPIVPKMRGKAFDFIPFQFLGPSSLDVHVEKPPLLDLVDVNLSHYRTSADLEHGAHFTALPTPWVTGVAADTPALRIGSGTAWVLGKEGQAGMLEYSGQGLSALEKQLERKERYMAVLGARLLEDQKAGVEAADTVRMRHAGENSVLASIADTASRGLTNCLTWYLQWLSVEKPPTIALNKEFTGIPMSSQDVIAMVDSWQRGAIGGEALYFNLKQGERLPDDMDFPGWQRDIEENGPTLTMTGMDNPDNAAQDNVPQNDNAGAGDQ